MERRPRTLAVLLTAALAVGPMSLAACGDDGGTAAEQTTGDASAGVAAAEAALAEGRTVIDVRTPEEFDAAHVEGAELIDVQGPDFVAQIEALDPDGSYVVYCRSGNRSAVAAAEMTELGLDVVDGGGINDMFEAGWPQG